MATGNLQNWPGPYLTREQVREVDRRAIQDFGMPGVVLMENAGRNAAAALLDRQPSGPVAILCGRGNNGGDGFVVARHLDNAGVPVSLLLLADPDSIQGDAAVNLEIARRSGLSMDYLGPEVDVTELETRLNSAAWIIDAILGTGSRGSLRDPLPAVIRTVNDSSARVLAIDLPSGLDCDTGETLGACVRADLTVTFVAPKIGFRSAGAREFLGKLLVADIGAPRAALEV